MILKVQSDASYLSKPQACSRAAGHFYMGNNGTDSDTNQGATLATTLIVKPVLSSASEAEIGALFENCKRAEILEPHWRKWDGRNQPHGYKQIIQQPVVLPTTTSSSNDQDQSIWMNTAQSSSTDVRSAKNQAFVASLGCKDFGTTKLEH
jgi:hypothetical protein